jgi:hypothetical protein
MIVVIIIIIILYFTRVHLTVCTDELMALMMMQRFPYFLLELKVTKPGLKINLINYIKALKR